ncbi:MAG: shikimate dehydrogenase [Aquificota bacterium]|nr:shikimate dehydrogenase [Aquificota bacterium]
MNITGRAEVYGVIGYPVKHSLSPVFQNSAFSYLGIEAVYVPFEVRPEDLRDAIRGLRSAGVRGLNVTVPHKESVLEVADRLSCEVEAIGASNTLVFSENGIEAYNTDWVGFLKAVEEITPLEGKKVLLLGSGGSARAVAYALKRRNCMVYVWNRTHEKAERLANRFGLEPVESPESVLEEVDIIVNTTSVGLDGEGTLFDYTLIRSDHTVIDLIYRDTPLIRTAREKGCLYQNGFPMLVYQGAESFRIWTGCEPPLKVMKMALLPYGYPKDSPRTPSRT